jgi:hypothetical protein
MNFIYTSTGPSIQGARRRYSKRERERLKEREPYLYCLLTLGIQLPDEERIAEQKKDMVAYFKKPFHADEIIPLAIVILFSLILVIGLMYLGVKTNKSALVVASLLSAIPLAMAIYSFRPRRKYVSNAHWQEEEYDVFAEHNYVPDKVMKAVSLFRAHVRGTEARISSLEGHHYLIVDTPSHLRYHREVRHLLEWNSQ